MIVSFSCSCFGSRVTLRKLSSKLMIQSLKPSCHGKRCGHPCRRDTREAAKPTTASRPVVQGPMQKKLPTEPHWKSGESNVSGISLFAFHLANMEKCTAWCWSAHPWTAKLMFMTSWTWTKIAHSRYSKSSMCPWFSISRYSLYSLILLGIPSDPPKRIPFDHHDTDEISQDRVCISDAGAKRPKATMLTTSRRHKRRTLQKSLAECGGCGCLMMHEKNNEKLWKYKKNQRCYETLSFGKIGCLGGNWETYNSQ